MDQQIENAVEHYRFLREQGLAPSAALTHAARRFGVTEKVMRERVNGRVADPVETKRLLAQVREHLCAPSTLGRDDDYETTFHLLSDLYTAITGETL